MVQLRSVNDQRMSNAIDLNGLRMNAVQTASGGVVNADTVFEFAQSGERVWATYAGGLVERGYLVGILRDERLEFRYCQVQRDGTLDGGHSRCELRRSADGRAEIVEHFEWGSRPGGGTNVIREMR